MTPDEIKNELERHAAWLRGDDDGARADLRGEDLRGADLRGADLSRADLRGANLVGAKLSGSCLRGARLSGAHLCGANLSRADLRGANLNGANLSSSCLNGANLNGAYLRGANLSGAYIRSADLTHADLVRADLSGASIPSDVPVITDIDAAILRATGEDGLHMGDWHTCSTVHCRAGWAITLCGQAGDDLERRVGPSTAGALIYAASGSHPVPDWFTSDEEALADMRKRASGNKVTT